MNVQSALCMSLTGFAWDTLNKIDPRPGDLDKSMKLIKDYGFYGWIPGAGLLTNQQAFTWFFNKIVERLRPHAGFIREEAHKLDKSGYLHPMHQWHVLYEYMKAKGAESPDVFGRNYVTPYSVKIAA